jgi:2-polyprenyl-3-methyl-5-hydroxy-6-metoxy-1,4-benzoquinol methylase
MSVVEVNKEFYNKLYKKRNPWISWLYSKISFDQQSKSKVNIRVIKQHLGDKFKQDLTVLDYGFGHGSLLLKYRKNHLLYGCDISEEAVFNFPSVAKIVGMNVRTGTVEEFLSKYNEVRFDVISLSHIIEHVDDDAGLVNSLAQKLSDKGVILINIPINEVWLDPKHVRKYDVNYTKALLEKCNLKAISINETDKLTSYFLIEEKVKNAGKLKRLWLRSLRLIFAIIPYGVLKAFENKFLSSHSDQQLVVLACRK